jgi:hypothetical protein
MGPLPALAEDRMTRSPLKIAALLAAALALGGCAANTPREEPHHYSKDRDGNRIACYKTEVASEYDCVPVNRRYGYAYDPYYYDPFWPYWSMGFFYGPQYVIHTYPSRPPPYHHRPR